MKKLLLALFVSLTPTMAMGQTKVFLGCQWTVFDHMEEAFVVDLAEKSVLWVDEEIELKIDVVLTDDLVERAIKAIEQAARTGRIGDGKIFVSNVENVIRIRTGERDANAL